MTPQSDKHADAEQDTKIVPAPAQRTLGGNTLVRMLGRGGMGEVWLGHDPKLDRHVAIKTMRREFAADQNAIARFLREARAVAKLSHPNIVPIFQIGEEADVIFFVMEFVNGVSLADWMKKQKTISLQHCLYILLQIVDGLEYAYSQGIIHRDIKPANIMIDRTSRVRITDFGLAKMLGADTQMTETGASMGSPCFMSPEQAKGDQVDFRSDMYSLGITFYQMITGELPHVAPTPVSVLLKHVQDPLPEPDTLRSIAGGAVLALLKKMTAKRPEDRFPDYSSLRQALLSLKTSAPAFPQIGSGPALWSPHIDFGNAPTVSVQPRTPEPNIPVPTPQGVSKRTLLIAVTCALLIGGTIAAAFLATNKSRSRRRDREQAEAVALPPTPPPPTPSTPEPRPDRDERDPARKPERPLSKLRNRLDEVGRIDDSYRAYDFAGAMTTIEQMLKSGRLTPERKNMLAERYQSMSLLRQFRDTVTTATAARAGQVAIDHPTLGTVVVIKVTPDGFVCRDAKSAEQMLKWEELNPKQIYDLAVRVVPRQSAEKQYAEFEKYYPLGNRANRPHPPRATP